MKDPAKQQREFERVYGSQERVDWVKAQRCCACHADTGCDNAHVPPKSDAGGTSRKADAKWIAPLCQYCHRVRLHNWGRATFEAYFKIDLEQEAIKLDARWQKLQQEAA